jgi:hypothetical protein
MKDHKVCSSVMILSLNNFKTSMILSLLREKHWEDFNDLGLQLLSPAEESDSWHQ